MTKFSKHRSNRGLWEAVSALTGPSLTEERTKPTRWARTSSASFKTQESYASGAKSSNGKALPIGISETNKQTKKPAEALKGIQIDKVKNCSEQWEKHLDRCTASNGEDFEDD